MAHTKGKERERQQWREAFRPGATFHLDGNGTLNLGEHAAVADSGERVKLMEAAGRNLGMPEAAAHAFATRFARPSEDTRTRLVESFMAMGLSRPAAEAAAKGRGRGI